MRTEPRTLIRALAIALDAYAEALREAPRPDGMGEDWIEIGKRCSANRRSLWVRLVPVDPDAPLTVRSTETIAAIELRAGREGEDAFARIDPSCPGFASVLDVILTQIFAVET